MYANKTFNLQIFEIGNKQQTIEMVVYSIVSFFLPMLLGHPQIVVGITVNVLLIMSALNLKNYKILPIIIFPSLGTLSRGLIFGPFTIYLVYMVPFIWIGNTILVYIFKKLHLQKKINFFLTTIIAAGLKSAFLFGITYLLFSLDLLPVIFLTAMGLMQFYTAAAAGVFAFAFSKVQKKAMLVKAK